MVLTSSNSKGSSYHLPQLTSLLVCECVYARCEEEVSQKQNKNPMSMLHQAPHILIVQ
jgi:hypothetical protein